MATPATPSAELRAGLRFAIQTLRKVKRREAADIERRDNANRRRSPVFHPVPCSAIWLILLVPYSRRDIVFCRVPAYHDMAMTWRHAKRSSRMSLETTAAAVAKYRRHKNARRPFQPVSTCEGMLHRCCIGRADSGSAGSAVETRRWGE